MGRKVVGFVLVMLCGAILIAMVLPGVPAKALQSPVSPPFTPLLWRPTPARSTLTPTPTARPTPSAEWAWNYSPRMIDVPMRLRAR